MKHKSSFTVHLMRHGQTVANREQRYLGASDSALTELGISQHRKIRDQLKDVNFRRIYSSPSERCLNLSQALDRERGILVQDERIRELDFGVFEMLQWQEAKEKYPEVWETYGRMDPDYCLPEGESLCDLETRIASFVKDLLSEDLDGDVAVVTHGGVATTFICLLLGFDPADRWRFRLENGHVAKIRIQDGFAYLEL